MPNEAFFVRYHLSNIPEVDAATWKLAVGGVGATGQAVVTLDELKKIPAVEIVAVNQCSGNRRGLFQPHVTGVEWGYGAMGCARWKGARLKDLLDKVGIKKDAIEITFNGADGPIVAKTPDFIKSIPVWKAMDPDTLVAYEMNGQPLPHFNGFPARIVVPGWTGTYWMKHVTSIAAVTKPETGFWMNPAYRIPLGKFPVVARFTSQETPVNTPITEMVVNSLITSHGQGANVNVGSSVMVGGIAWDGGYGLQVVEVSTDGGIVVIASRIVNQLGGLRLSNLVGRARHERVLAFHSRRELKAEGAEGEAAQIFPELGRQPDQGRSCGPLLSPPFWAHQSPCLS
jgi:DMSO/TMAO reductase YedYZ molybdopterin-dependent catalytic subunit